MGRALGLVKATELPEETLDWHSFSEALKAGVIDATLDAQWVLYNLDRQSEIEHLTHRAARYVVLSVEQVKERGRVITYGTRLLKKGWSLFLDYESFLAFACGGFKKVLPSTCDSVSVLLQSGAEPTPLTVTPQGDRAFIDTHPAEFAAGLLGAWPIGKGENILVLR